LEEFIDIAKKANEVTVASEDLIAKATPPPTPTPFPLFQLVIIVILLIILVFLIVYALVRRRR
jgi:hypothetical protein